MSRRRGHCIYVLCAGAAVVLALECLLRLTHSDPEYYWNERYLFVTPNVYQNRGDGFWTYRPHAAIREAKDGHPNRQGYDKLVACADAALDRMK